MPLPRKLQRCVVFFGTAPDRNLPLPQAGSKFLGTGFVVSFPFANGRFAHNYLVTNAHVADHLQSIPTAFVRINATSGNAKEVWLDGAVWTKHIRPEVDVAILRPDFRKFPAWSETAIDALYPDEFLPVGALDDISLGVGDPIHVSGLLTNTPGATRNMPLVRSGTLAALADEPIEVKTGKFEPAHLGMIQSIGGMSGSPVFLEFRPHPYGTTPVVGRPWGYLLGVNAGHFNGIIDGASQMANSGINLIFPVERLLEIFQQPEVVEESALFEKAIRKAYPEHFSDIAEL